MLFGTKSVIVQMEFVPVSTVYLDKSSFKRT